MVRFGSWRARLATPVTRGVRTVAGRGRVGDFARDVRKGFGLAQKRLPSRYLYDAVGSALFDAITLLPEYGLTRADERVLRRCAPLLPEQLGRLSAVVELGSGSGLKTRPLLEAFCDRQGSLRYVAIDGSRTALDRCRKELADVRGLRVEGLASFYLEGLSRALKGARKGPVLVLFLGGSIGNFDPEEGVGFLRDVRKLLEPKDALLLGADLEKPVETLIAAYDDPAGVTAAFNLNVLARINRELDGNFDLSLFRHEARWSALERRIEMHLRSVADQSVRIGALRARFPFLRNETLWTESSHRFTPDLLEEMAGRAGFSVSAEWTDEAWAFSESLWIADAATPSLGPRSK
jgi:L-histidine N-alpha-methyltransferase